MWTLLAHALSCIICRMNSACNENDCPYMYVVAWPSYHQHCPEIWMYLPIYRTLHDTMLQFWIVNRPLVSTQSRLRKFELTQIASWSCDSSCTVSSISGTFAVGQAGTTERQTSNSEQTPWYAIPFPDNYEALTPFCRPNVLVKLAWPESTAQYVFKVTSTWSILTNLTFDSVMVPPCASR